MKLLRNLAVVRTPLRMLVHAFCARSACPDC
jgi:hypothetical protein